MRRSDASPAANGSSGWLVMDGLKGKTEDDVVEPRPGSFDEITARDAAPRRLPKACDSHMAVTGWAGTDWPQTACARQREPQYTHLEHSQASAVNQEYMRGQEGRERQRKCGEAVVSVDASTETTGEAAREAA